MPKPEFEAKNVGKSNTDFVAPQNSLADVYKIPRYHFNPYMLSSRSCPPSVHASPHESKKTSTICLQNVVSEKSSALFSVGVPAEPKVFKRGIVVKNILQSRLYDSPENSDESLCRNPHVSDKMRSPYSPYSQKISSTYQTQIIKRNPTLIKGHGFLRPQSEVGENVWSNADRESSLAIPQIDVPSKDDVLARCSSLLVAERNIKACEREANAACNIDLDAIPDKMICGKARTGPSQLVSACDQVNGRKQRLFSSKADEDSKYSSLSILEILFHLRKRLNWSHIGILEGACPKESSCQTENQVDILEDDGEFVYCLPRHYGNVRMQYDPYDLCYIPASHACHLGVYFTLSASYVSKVDHESGNSRGSDLVPVLEWLHERQMFYKIYNIRLFKMFRLWKTFRDWRLNVRQNKEAVSRSDIGSLLFIASPHFAPAILLIKSFCEASVPSNNHDRLHPCLCLLELGNVKTFDLTEFRKLQAMKCQTVKHLLIKLRMDAVDAVAAACRSYYEASLAAIEATAADLEKQEGLKVGGRHKKKGKFRSQHAGQRIVENETPSARRFPILSAHAMVREKQEIYKYTKLSKIKAVHQRMSSFIRYIDFIIMSMLRDLVVSAVSRLFDVVHSASRPIDTSSTSTRSRDETRADSDNDCGSVAHPIFELQATLKMSVKNHEGKTFFVPFKSDCAIGNNESLTIVDAFCDLSPSYEAVELAIRSIIHEFEAVACDFDSLVNDDRLQFYVKEPHSGFELNYDMENASLKASMKATWPDSKLLFLADAKYQALASEMLKDLHLGFMHAGKYVQDFKKFCDMVTKALLWDVEDSLTKQEWTCDQFYDVLSEITEQIFSVQSLTGSKCIPPFIVKSEEFRDNCLPYLRKNVNCINTFLPGLANRRNEVLLQAIKNGQQVLSAEIKTVEDFGEHLSYLSKLSEDISNMEKELATVSRLFAIASNFGAQFSAEDWAQYQTLGPSLQILKDLIMYCEAKKDERIQHFSQDLCVVVSKVVGELRNLANQIRTPSLLAEDTTPSAAMEMIAYLSDDVLVLSSQTKNFQAYEEQFSGALSVAVKKRAMMLGAYYTYGDTRNVSKVSELLEELSDVERDLKLRRLLWESLVEWDDLVSKWRMEVFSALDSIALQKDITRFEQTLRLLEKDLPRNALVPKLNSKISLFKAGMPLISSLKCSALKTRHWVEITKIIGNAIISQKGFTLGQLMEIEAFKYTEVIAEIASRASNEATLELMLRKVMDHWKHTDFQLLAHAGRDVAIISGTDVILSAIDEGLVTLANIRGSRFSGAIQEKVEEWEGKLSLFLRTLEEWIQVQRSWLYLETIFSANDIQRQLPSETKMFSHVDKSWRDLMRKTIDRPNALTAATAAGVLDILQSCGIALEKIHHSLEDYLDMKRMIFPRFYFLSNEDLLDILANNKNPACVQPYLLKCFASIKHLDIVANPRTPAAIIGMISEEGERVEFTKALKARGTVEQWLSNLELTMFDSVKQNLKQALSDYSEDNFPEWALRFPGQVVITITQVMFGHDVEQGLRNNGLPEVLSKQRANLDLLSSIVKNDLPYYKHQSAVNLIITLVHARDVVSDLVLGQVSVVDDFQWVRQLKYCWDGEISQCMVKQSISTFVYGYEYLGCSSRLVVTPLTDRCYLTLTCALHFNLGCSPTGPAGTGKSESVKDLAKALGKQCLVFNCSESMDFKMIGKLISGLSQSGSWICFDEFNRIDVEVLSVIAQQLHVVKAAKDAGAVRFLFEGRDIKLNPSSAVFITMNPQYAGRVELPDNIKSLFRPVAMVLPDNSLISEVLLYSYGFSFAKLLSGKLITTYELAGKQLSAQHHYDFGLRSIKAVLTNAGEKNRKEIVACSNDQQYAREIEILLKAIMDTNMPKFIAADVLLFENILLDVFQTSFSFQPESAKLEKFIGVALRELSYQRWLPQVQKVLQLHNMLLARHGVMLIGPTGGGKTTVRKILRKALSSMHELSNETKSSRNGVDMVTINPKSVTLEELYGMFEANTHEWTDGLLSSTVRRFAKQNAPVIVSSTLDSSESGNSSNVPTTSTTEEQGNVQDTPMNFTEPHRQFAYQWLVLDGPVDTLWVENVNTVLDDSKILCLANGERIALLPSMKFLFEVDSLEHASPATVSRCGMIYLDPKDLGWRPAIKSWLQGLREKKVPEECREYLWKLFDFTVDRGMAFLQKFEKNRLCPVPSLAVVKTVLGILGALIDHLASRGGFNYAAKQDENHIGDKRKPCSSGSFQQDSRFSERTHSLSEIFIKDGFHMKSLISKLFIFAYMWGFGGHFECVAADDDERDVSKLASIVSVDSAFDIRHEFDGFLRDMFDKESAFRIPFPIGNHLLFSYYVDIDKNQFQLWEHLARDPATPIWRSFANSRSPSNSFAATAENWMRTSDDTPVVSTAGTVCFSFLLSLLSLNGLPVLLVGKSGVGKSVLVKEMLRRIAQPGGAGLDSASVLGCVLNPATTGILDNIIPAAMKPSYHDEAVASVVVSLTQFSALTTADKPRTALRAKLVQKGREILCPRPGEKVALFIDDLNAPLRDQNGVQPALEFVREFLEASVFYDTKKLQWKTITGLVLISAATAASGRRVLVSQRLLQKFCTLCLPEPSLSSLFCIFRNQLAPKIDSAEFSPEVRLMRFDVVSAAISIYYEISRKLKATPRKCHYLFNVRDVSKVIEGLLNAHPSVIKTKEHFVELLVHEATRVFADRFVEDSDRLIFEDVVLKQVKDMLKVTWSRDRLRDEAVLFADFLQTDVTVARREYQCVRDVGKLGRLIEDFHDSAKLSGKLSGDAFIAFPAVVEHVVRAARVLRQPGGHLLMVGIGGTGKQTVARMAACLEGCHFIHPILTRNHSLADLKEDVRSALIKAGRDGKRTVLFMNDTNLVQMTYLETVCGIIDGSDLAECFDDDSREQLAMQLKAEVATFSGDLDSVDSIFDIFLARVRENLHIIVATTPSGNSFIERCRMYPCLIHNTTIDWFLEWPPTSLVTVASRILAEESFAIGHDSSLDLKADISSALVSFHEITDKVCYRFRKEVNRYYFVSPKSFLDLAQLFVSLYRKTNTKSEQWRARLLNGLQKLRDTNCEIECMNKELSSLGPKLKKKAEETEQLLEKLAEDRDRVNKIKSVVQREQEVTDRETQRVQAIANEARHDLIQALPELEAATAALDALNKYDITEIRTYSNPPPLVATLLFAVCVLLNQKPDWTTAKLLISDPNFLKTLVHYDRNSISDKMHNRLKRYTQLPDFNPSVMGRMSNACKSICSWILALEHYAEVNKVVRPKQLKCEKAQVDLAVALEHLVLKQQTVAKVVAQLKILEDNYAQNVVQLNELKESHELTIARMKRASLLIAALETEKTRWTECAEKIANESAELAGNALLLAASSFHLGAFVPTYRALLLTSWKEVLKSRSILFSSDFDVVSSCAGSVLVQEWVNNGLPRDRHSKENAVFMKTSHHWPYIIDPQGQATSWISLNEKHNRPRLLKSTDPNYMKTVESAIRLGEPVLLTSCTENLDCALDAILLKALCQRGNQAFITLGDTEIEYNDGFRLYLFTSIANPILLPEVCIKVTVLNFIITAEGLCDQILSNIVRHERAELEEQRCEILDVIVADRIKMNALEDRCLELLHASSGNILDDEDLIRTLDDSKNVAELIKHEVLEAEAAERDIETSRQIYLPLAERGVVLYFVMEDMAKVDVAYQFSMSWFMELFGECLSLQKGQAGCSNSKSNDESVSDRRPSSAKARLSRAREYALSSTIVRRRLDFLYSVENNQSAYLQTMIDLVTDSFYRMVSCALFARHQLLFSFYLTIRINMHTSARDKMSPNSRSQVSAEEFSWLLESDSHAIAGCPSEDEDLAISSKAGNLPALASSSAGHIVKELGKPPLKGMTQLQWNQCSALSSTLTSFAGLCSHISSRTDWWTLFMATSDPVCYLRNEEAKNEYSNLPSYSGLHVPSLFDPATLTLFQCILLVKVLRPDYMVEAIHKFICEGLGSAFVSPPTVDLHDLYTESSARHPIMFVLSPGSDPSSQLVRFVKEVRGSALHLEMISLGKGQERKALEAIRRAYAQKGKWVFLQNCHLSLSFMPKLEGVINELTDPDVVVDPQFRLWLSSKPSKEIPVSILQKSMKVAVEPPPGIRHSLLTSFAHVKGVISQSMFEDSTRQHGWKQALYTISLFHAVLKDRTKFGVFGWNVPYEFISTDLEVVVMVLHDLIASSGDLPWTALRLLTGEIIYGGRVTDFWDQRCLTTLLAKFYSNDILNPNFSYLDTNVYKPPLSTVDYAGLIASIETLPNKDLPDLFGMAAGAEFECVRQEGKSLLSSLVGMQPVNHLVEGELDTKDVAILARAKAIRQALPEQIVVSRGSGLLRASFVGSGVPDRPDTTVAQRSSQLLSKTSGGHLFEVSLLSKSVTSGNVLPALDRSSLPEGTSDLSTDSASRKAFASLSTVVTFLDQEKERFDNLLNVLHESLTALGQAISGDVLMSAELEALQESLVKNEVPQMWKKHASETSKPLGSWLRHIKLQVDFVTRWIEKAQLARAQPGCPLSAVLPNSVWLPALFFPQGFLSAVLQSHARATSVAIDSLTFVHHVSAATWAMDGHQSLHEFNPVNIAFQQTSQLPRDGVGIFGLFIDGAKWNSDENCLEEADAGRRFSILPEVLFTPVQIAEIDDGRNSSSFKPESGMFVCPVYQTALRSSGMRKSGNNCVTSIPLRTKQPPEKWILNGIAAVCEAEL